MGQPRAEQEPIRGATVRRLSSLPKPPCSHFSSLSLSSHRTSVTSKPTNRQTNRKRSCRFSHPCKRHMRTRQGTTCHGCAIAAWFRSLSFSLSLSSHAPCLQGLPLRDLLATCLHVLAAVANAANAHHATLLQLLHLLQDILSWTTAVRILLFSMSLVIPPLRKGCFSFFPLYFCWNVPICSFCAVGFVIVPLDVLATLCLAVAVSSRPNSCQAAS